MINDIEEPFFFVCCPDWSSRTRQISSAMTITFHHESNILEYMQRET